jgi:RNA-directed DNA polymerase
MECYPLAKAREADIAKCFDKIDHNVLLSKLNTFPTISRQIRAWLKAGVIDFSEYALREKSDHTTPMGVPQGGAISPLLANIAGRLFGRKSIVASQLP